MLPQSLKTTNQLDTSELPASTRDTGNPIANAISSFGQFIGAPTVFDWDTSAARQDVLTGSDKRNASSAAALNMASTPYNTINGITYNAFGDPLTSTASPTSQYNTAPTNTSGNVSGDNINKNTGSNDTYQKQAMYDDTINQINRILGLIDTSEKSGLEQLGRSEAQQRENQKLARERAMKGYDEQRTSNLQDRSSALGQVDQYTGDSFNNFQRLLQGANAGKSSVARELIPSLLARAAASRRQSAFDQSGKNAQSIDRAAEQTSLDYNAADQDLEDQITNARKSFSENIIGQRNSNLAKLAEAQGNRAVAGGASYEGVRAATQGANQQISSNYDQLANLFNTYKPTFAARNVTAATPELSKYNVDRINVASQQANPSSDSYFLQQMKKRQENQL